METKLLAQFIICLKIDVNAFSVSDDYYSFPSDASLPPKAGTSYSLGTVDTYL